MRIAPFEAKIHCNLIAKPRLTRKLLCVITVTTAVLAVNDLPDRA
jgi:hypothetical protein